MIFLELKVEEAFSLGLSFPYAFTWSLVVDIRRKEKG